MKPESLHFLTKSFQLLDEADRVLEVDLFNAAGRAAYLAGFHAAQAFIFERTDRVVKTHNGVRTLFQQLALEPPALPDDLEKFLANTYQMKAIADYEIGPGSEVSSNEAAHAVALAHRFVAHFMKVLGG